MNEQELNNFLTNLQRHILDVQNKHKRDIETTRAEIDATFDIVKVQYLEKFNRNQVILKTELDKQALVIAELQSQIEKLRLNAGNVNNTLNMLREDVTELEEANRERRKTKPSFWAQFIP